MSLDETRAAFVKHCDSRIFKDGIHAVTFQPTPNRANEDRYVVEEWDDVCEGPSWLFMAVLDGHAGSEAADHTAKHLPTFLRDALRSGIKDLGTNYTASEISTLLRSHVEKFDLEIGLAVTSL
ncbi:hypothetical protein H0H93_003039, partial [Arthromyces matolae]